MARLIIESCPLKQLRDDSTRRYHYEDILGEPMVGERFSGKIVLVGQENEDDKFKVFSAFRSEVRYGFEVHADILNTLLQGTTIQTLGLWEQFLVMLAMGTLGAIPHFYGPLASPVWRRYYLGVVLTAYIALAICLYVKCEILFNIPYHLGTLFITYWTLGKAARKLGLLENGTDKRRYNRRT